MSKAEALLLGSVVFFFVVMASVIIADLIRNPAERSCEERGGVLVMTSRGPACAKLQLIT